MIRGMWTGERVRDPVLVDAYAAVEDLASWSPWLPLVDAVPVAPREPGAYLLRDPATQVVVHVGMAGERAGAGRAQGLRGRLADHLAGSGAIGGFDEAALDRALADPVWLEQRLTRLREEGPRRARRWAADAVRHLSPEVSWAVRPERADAVFLETEVVLVLRPLGLWSR